MKSKHPRAAQGAFDKVWLRTLPTAEFVTLANEFAEVINLAARGGEGEVEASKLTSELATKYGFKDFAKCRKQVHQEYTRRFQVQQDEKYAADIQEAMVDIEFQRRPWTPFAPAVTPPFDENDPKTAADIQNLMETSGFSREQVIAQFREIENDEIWLNSKYQVNVRREKTVVEGVGEAELVHLSIKRIDKRPVRDWRDFQRIKDELLGRNCEAVELFPAQRRMVDTANQYHLWGIASTQFEFPVGWNQRLVADAPANPENHNMRQRPLEPGQHVEEPEGDAAGPEPEGVVTYREDDPDEGSGKPLDPEDELYQQ